MILNGNKMNFLNVAHIVPATKAEGPGLRFVIWVQGCLKRCKGCCNGDLLKIKPANIMSSQNIIEQIIQTKNIYPNLEGVTFLGGEPFLQAQGLADIAEFAQSVGLSVMIFTGYLLSELNEEKFSGSLKLLMHTDLLIDGEFDINQQETMRNWVGSTNQVFHYLSDFYNPEIETCILPVTNEWRIDLTGQISGNGLPFQIR